MEGELRCGVCKQLYNNPVLLPCYHAACLDCAVQLQQPAITTNPQPPPTESVPSTSCTDPSDYQEVDKLSIVSETDSGVVCNSRPNSYVGTPNLQGILFPPLATTALSLACPVCQKLVYFDENGALNLPKYRVLQNIVEKYSEVRNSSLKCQMCESDPARDATVFCEQCSVLYCDICREACHPSRGPLAKHILQEPSMRVMTQAQRMQFRNELACNGSSVLRDGFCAEHEEEPLSMFCMVCKVPVCANCLHDTRHTSHDVQAINSMCKLQKV